ncbi:MPN157 family protein [Mycoplasmoides pirum]|uniref:MPN157 family protein n=1 Tax=Mycoplasmoides pirum TaxID=2122 RepID=UPI000698CEF6|nr:hypothetical protein [Mycoplasmoides pirum]
MENINDNQIEQKLGIKVVDANLDPNLVENDLFDKETSIDLGSKPNKKTKIKNKKNKKQQNKINKFGRYVTLNLNQKDKLKKEWYIVLGISILMIVFFSTLLGFTQYFVGLSGSSVPAITNVNNLNNVMRIMSIISIVLLALPYLYLGAAFFSGINQIHKSKSVHIMIWFTFIINGLLLLICSIILIVAYAGLDPSVLQQAFNH